MPALFTRMSMRPWRSSTPLIIDSIDALSVTSSGTASAFRPDPWISDTVAAALSPRAVATTCAPREASIAATPRPIPRDAPVTIATLPVRSRTQTCFHRREIVRRGEVEDACVLVDLFDETAEHGAGAHLNIVGDAFRRKAADHLLPAHRRGHLPDERVDRGGRVALQLRVDVRHDGHARVLRAQRAEIRFEPILRRLEQRAMERRAHRERNHAPGPERPGALARALDGLRGACDHDLTGAVDVRGADDLALRGLFARARNRVGLEAQDRRHRSGADGHGFLHVLPAPPHHLHRVPELEGAGSDVGGVLAEAVAGDERRLDASCRKHTLRGDAD